MPSLDGLLADGEGMGSQQQPHDLELSNKAAAAQQAALHLLESLLQVLKCTTQHQHVHETLLARLMLVISQKQPPDLELSSTAAAAQQAALRLLATLL